MKLWHLAAILAVVGAVLLISSRSTYKHMQEKRDACIAKGGVTLKDFDADYFCVINGNIYPLKEKK